MRRLSALAFALLLAACAPMDPGQPGLAMVDEAALGLQPGVDTPWPASDWWERYRDPQLSRLMDRALAGNPDLAAASTRVRLANAAVRGAQAAQWPQLDARYEATRQHYSENSIYPPPLGGSMDTDNSLLLRLSFDPDLWGRQRALAEAAGTREVAAEVEARQARSMVALAVAQAYFELQGALQQSKTLDGIVAKQDRALQITRERVAQGLGTQVDVDQATAAVAATRVQAEQARNQAELLHNQLAALIGTGPGELPAIAGRQLADPPPTVPAALPLDLLGRRPDVVAAKLQVLAAGAEISAAQADFFPNIDLTAFAGFASLGLDRLLQPGSRSYGAGPAITLPIFHAGALNARLDSRRAARDLAIAQYNRTVLDAVREVADAAASIRSLRRQIAHQDASLKASTSAYDIALKRYQAGLGDFVQVLLAQSDALTQAVRASDLHARSSVLDAQLATALGGGFAADPANPSS